MKFKALARQILPPIFLDIYRRYRYGMYLGPNWEGIYRNYRDVPATGPGFDGDAWRETAFAAMERLLSISSQYGTIPSEITGGHNLLPMLAALVCRHSGKVSILDFGGGIGLEFIHLVSGMAHSSAVDYHIVERRTICDDGLRVLRTHERIKFHTSLPTDLTEIDIVHMRSALQYIEDYTDLLRRLCAFQPRYFLFVELSAGDIPTYATAQRNLRGSIIPYWFINVNELIETMSEAGYSLIFKGASEKEYDQSNFPKEYRLERACNLLFARD